MSSLKPWFDRHGDQRPQVDAKAGTERRGLVGGAPLGYAEFGRKRFTLVDLQIGDERVAELAETAVLARGVAPGEVGELAVDRDRQKLHADLFELLGAVREGDDLRRADEGEVERVEEQRYPLALVVAELDFFDAAVGEDRLGLEVGGFFLFYFIFLTPDCYLTPPLWAKLMGY